MYWTVWITALVVLVSILLVLLIKLRRSEHQTAVISRMNQDDFSDFLRLNSLEGSVQVVAEKASDLLRNACACEKVVFFRKERHYLELNHKYKTDSSGGLPRIPITPELTVELTNRGHPASVRDLESLLPGDVYSQLRQWRCTHYFPIIWREELYGLYFIHSRLRTDTASFRIIISTLAQSLSVAFHVKDQEEKLERLEERTAELEEASRKMDRGLPATPVGVLKLVRHRNSETLVSKIIDEVRKDLELEQFAFMYESKEVTAPVCVVKHGVAGSIVSPPRPDFEQLIAQLSGGNSEHVADLSAATTQVTELSSKLQEAGLKYMTSFPVSAHRSGLLAWSDARAPEAVLSRLRMHGLSCTELMENAESFERVQEESYTDNLTGLANRRYFNKRLDEEIGRARRYRRSLGLIILDLDELKYINDRFGHQAGDAIIRRLGEVLRRSIRSIDVTARFGGDEFCVIMPESDSSTCMQFMGRLQSKISRTSFEIGQTETDLVCTISQGGAVFPEHGTDAEQLIFAADMALLRAKEGGRNRYLLF